MKNFKITQKGFLCFACATLVGYLLAAAYLIKCTKNAHLTPEERAVPIAPLLNEQAAMEEWQWDAVHKFCKERACGTQIDQCIIDEDFTACAET